MLSLTFNISKNARIDYLKCYRNQIRRIFSVTGEWPWKLENEHLHKIEEHWKPIVPELVKSAQNELPGKPLYSKSSYFDNKRILF